MSTNLFIELGPRLLKMAFTSKQKCITAILYCKLLFDGNGDIAEQSKVGHFQIISIFPENDLIEDVRLTTTKTQTTCTIMMVLPDNGQPSVTSLMSRGEKS